MAAGRFGGDRLVGRFGAVPVLRASGVGSAAGLTVALLAERPALAVVGCGAVGLGIANVVPILFSAAGRTPGIAPAAALAGVATMGYLGFLAGPPVIGLVADAAGLRTGLAVVGLLCAVIAGSASLAKRNA
jgi:fucose permease